MQPPAKAGRLTRSLAVNGGVFIFIAAIVACAFVSAYWMSASARVASIIPAGWGALPPQQPPAPAPDAAEPATTACPAYFRWIHEDLRPWRATGITRETLEGARRYGAKFRVTVLAGRLYVARYGRCFQTRDVFTQWGILQLLRRYAGRLPDLDLMFDCQDLPVVNAGDHTPPPLFRYCGSEFTLDIAFPDWSFWGWPELNIKPWEALRREISEANAALDWTRRTPYAYWKGNPTVGAARRELLKCNVSRERDWNARIYVQARHSYAVRSSVSVMLISARSAFFSGLEDGGARRVQGIGLGQAVHAQVQDVRGRARVVGEREVHPGVRLRDAGRAPEVPRLLLQGARAAATLLARAR
ncbi:hypothetical protein VPH35_038590 [Triticum aestivum]